MDRSFLITHFSTYFQTQKGEAILFYSEIFNDIWLLIDIDTNPQSIVRNYIRIDLDGI